MLLFFQLFLQILNKATLNYFNQYSCYYQFGDALNLGFEEFVARHQTLHTPALHTHTAAYVVDAAVSARTGRNHRHLLIATYHCMTAAAAAATADNTSIIGRVNDRRRACLDRRIARQRAVHWFGRRRWRFFYILLLILRFDFFFLL